MVAKELLEPDYKTRVACCKDILENIPANPVLITSNEDHFHLSGFVNKQNFCYWLESNPRELHERLLHRERVTVWCAVANFGVWNPYFLEVETKAVSVTSACYEQMLQNFLEPKLKDLGANATVWFQEDGATVHTAKKSIDVLLGLFSAHLIS